MTKILYGNTARCGKTIMPKIIKEMKERLPTDPRTKPYFDKIVADGFTEEEAKEIIITAWIKQIKGDVE